VTIQRTGYLRNLEKERFRKLYYLLSNVRTLKTRRMRYADRVGVTREMRTTHRVLAGKPGGRRLLRLLTRRLDDNNNIGPPGLHTLRVKIKRGHIRFCHLHYNVVTVS
jgi:hypothetical protein